MTRTHTTSQWTRTSTGHGFYTICREDGTVAATVVFLSAGDWRNLDADDHAQQHTDRVVQIDGEPLPAWAMDWLTAANRRQKAQARETLRAMQDDADDNLFFGRDTGW